MNDNKYIRKSHNCYAYALDRIDMKMAKKCVMIMAFHLLNLYNFFYKIF